MLYCYLLINLSLQLIINEYPFIGTRHFNFTGGSCCNETISISKEGKCIIKAYQASEIGNNVLTIYNGEYSQVIWIYSKGKKEYGYKIEKNYITQLNANGKAESGCREEGKPCRTRLEL